MNSVYDLNAPSESSVRRKAKRHGMYICKSRERHRHFNNRGGYMLVDAYSNIVRAGVDFDLTLPAAWEMIDVCQKSRIAT